MSQTEGPDRRPLLYTLVGLIILGVAALLFWPDRGVKSPPSMVLTPESVRQASNLEAPVGSEADTTTAGTASGIETVDVAGDRFPVKDATLPSTTTPKAQTPADQTARPTTKQATKQTTATTPTTTRSEPATRPRSTPARPSPSGSVVTPSSSGHYLLYVGSYRDESNARAAADRLIAQAVRADVVNSGDVYRVRVGFFATAEDAEVYGRSLKGRVGLDYWVSQR